VSLRGRETVDQGHLESGTLYDRGRRHRVINGPTARYYEMSRRIVIIARCTNTLTYLLISCRASVSHTSARGTRVVAVVGVRAVASALTTTSNLNTSLSVLPPTRRLQSTNVATAGVTILTNVETSTTTYHAADAGVTRHLPPPGHFPLPDICVIHSCSEKSSSSSCIYKINILIKIVDNKARSS